MGRATMPAAERVLRRIEYVDGCWEFQGAKNAGGYGLVKNKDGSQLAHRAVYEALVGPIPDGHEPDHLCRNPPCCAPHHMEPVTRRVNALRGTSGDRQRAKTHCPHGHPYDEENTIVEPNGNSTRRQCRECRRIRRKLRYERQKAVTRGS